MEHGPLGPLGAHPELPTHAHKSTPRARRSAPKGGGSQIWGRELGQGSPLQGFSSVTAPARLPNLLVCRCTQAPPSRPRPRAPALACLPLDPWSWCPWVLSTPSPLGHTVPGTQGRWRHSASLPGTCGRSQPRRGGSRRDHKRGPCREARAGGGLRSAGTSAPAHPPAALLPPGTLRPASSFEQTEASEADTAGLQAPAGPCWVTLGRHFPSLS